MKKFFLLCAACAIAMSSFAYDFYLTTPEGARLYYQITKEAEETYDDDGTKVTPGEVKVCPELTSSSSSSEYTYYKGPSYIFNHHIVIPDTVEYNSRPYAVTEVADYTFYTGSSNNYYLKSLILPRTLRKIGQYAFYRALPSKTGVTTAVTIPVNVDMIAENAFYGCAKLDITWLAKKCFVAENAFYDALRSIVFGTEVTEVPANICRENKSITAVTLPYAITNIGDYAFFNCSELSKVAIGEGVEHIGRLAFSGCVSLSHIISAAVEPPVAEPYAFIDIPLDVEIEVPCGQIAAYAQAPEWSYFWYMAETIIYKATVLVEDYEQGNATVDYNCESATFHAMPNAGYKFKEWSNGMKDNPLTLPMTSNISLVAHFEGTPQGIDQIEESGTPIKRIENGQLLIERDGKTYNVIGTMVIK